MDIEMIAMGSVILMGLGLFAFMGFVAWLSER